jgi:Fe-S cluster biogenesis protein NfuA
MPAPSNLRATGDRIESLLDQLQATAEPRVVALAEELLQLVSELYGAGLGRAVELARSLSPAVVEAFAGDDLVASLLVVHGLHPETLDRRVERALEKVRPFLSSHAGDVELIAIDAEAGALKLRLLGSCDGCPSSAVTLQMAVERAITEAAPEIVRIDVDEPSLAPQSVPIALGVKPPVYDQCPVEVASA